MQRGLQLGTEEFSRQSKAKDTVFGVIIAIDEFHRPPRTSLYCL